MNIIERMNSNMSWRWSILKKILQILALGYELATRCRNWAFDYGILHIQKVSVPVFSLGNITAGGTGKTPASIWLAQQIQKRENVKPVIISRGYGCDESQMLKYYLPKVPHYINSKRVLAAFQAIAEQGKSICLILDDGFQHRYLARDVNFILIDALRPFGWGNTLPAGLLRESLNSLSRADIIFITRSDQLDQNEVLKIQEILSKYSRAKQFLAKHRPISLRNIRNNNIVSLDSCSQKRLLPVVGIGNPQSFLKTLEKLNCNTSELAQIYPDHHKYSSKDWNKLIELLEKYNCEGIVTTSKDSVKLFPYINQSSKESAICSKIDIWSLEIEFYISDDDNFWLSQYIDNILKTYSFS